MTAARRWTLIALAAAALALLAMQFRDTADRRDHSVEAAPPVAEPMLADQRTATPAAHTENSANTSLEASPSDEATHTVITQSLPELIAQAQQRDPAAEFQAALDAARQVSLRDGGYDIGPAGSYRLVVEEEPTPLELRIADEHSLPIDAKALARFTGPSGRWALEALPGDGTLTLQLPAAAVREGVYLLDINLHKAKNPAQRRYILQLVQ